MGWAKFDAQTHRKRKVRRLSDPSWRLWVSAIMDCCAEESDGLIDGTTLTELLPKHQDKYVKELVDAGLLHDRPSCESEQCLSSQGLPISPDMYVIHDYAQWQMTAVEWAKHREQRAFAAHKKWHQDEPKKGCRWCYPLEVVA